MSFNPGLMGDPYLMGDPGVLPNHAVDESDIEEITISFYSVLALHAVRGVAGELLVDPVYHGWR